MTRISGDDRTKLALDLRAKYLAGTSIRSLAASSGYAYGTVRNLLLSVKTPLRKRGGMPGVTPKNRRKPAQS